MPSENPTDKPGDKAAALVALRDTRERVIACLSDEFAHDRLELEEFERRLGIAHRLASGYPAVDELTPAVVLVDRHDVDHILLRQRLVVTNDDQILIILA